MLSREDELKKAIEGKYGSILKFSEETGIPKTTIYNVFSRGVANTRTATMDTIYAFVKLDEDEDDHGKLDEAETELLELFGKMGEKKRAALLTVAHALLES